MAIQNDDLLLVNRAGNSYTTEYSEIKTDIIDSVPVVDPGVTEIVAGDNVTIDPADGLGSVTVNTAVGEAPNDGKQYGRQDEAWSEIISGSSGVTSIIAGSGISVDQATGDVTITNTGGSGEGGTTKADIYGTAKAWGTVDGVNATLKSGKYCTVARNGSLPGRYIVTFDTPMVGEYTVTTGNESFRGLVGAQNQSSTGFELTGIDESAGDFADLGNLRFAVYDEEPAEIIVGSGTVANTNLYGTAKAWGAFSASAFLEGFNFDVNSFSKSSVGSYTLTFVEPMSSDQYSVTATSNSSSGRLINIVNKTATSFDVRSRSISTDNLTDGDFNLAVHDNEPAEVALTTFGDVINYSGAAAWGNVAGDGALNGGLNIASVTKQGTGQFLVTFSTPMPDENYAVTSAGESTNNFVAFNSLTTTSFVAYVKNNSNTFVDNPFYFAVHALNALPPKGGTGTDSWATVQADGTLDASFNVASVTKTETGVYDVVFTTPMPTSAYSVVISGSGSSQYGNFWSLNRTTTGFTVKTQNANNTVTDRGFSVAVNATNATLPSTITQEEADLILDTINSGGVGQKVAILADVKPNGTAGGASVADSWNERTLNTIQSDTGNLVTLANDKEFTLKPGTYLIEFSAPAWNSDRHKIRLVNVTDGVTRYFGENAYNYTGNNALTRSCGTARVQITSDTTYKIEHFIRNNDSGNEQSLGMSTNTGTGDDEVYTQVTITDLAVLAAGGSGGGGSTEIYGTAKAWGKIKFDGSLIEGYNAQTASTGTGVYSVVFETPLSNANYTVQLTATLAGIAVVTGIGNQTATGFNLLVSETDSSSVVPDFAHFAVFDNEPITVSGGGGGSTEIYGTAKAWGYTQQDGTISSGSNLSCSASSNEFTYTFDSPMANADYSVLATIDATDNIGWIRVRGKSVNGFTVLTNYPDGSGNEYRHSVAVFDNEPVTVSGGGGDATGVGADSWGNVAVDGTLEASFNVASVTRTSLGIYDVVFTTPMPSQYYGIQLSTEPVPGQYTPICVYDNATTTGFTVYGINVNGQAGVDAAFSFTVFASSTVTPTYTWKRDGTTLKPANDGDVLEVGPIDATTPLGFTVDTSGLISSYVAGDGNSAVVVKQGSTVKTRIRGDGAIFINNNNIALNANGSGNFVGKVTASNVSFSLEPDNAANFSAEGEYTGPTLDVKELLLTLQTAAARISALESGNIVDDATDSSLIQLIASLAARVTALEGN